MSISPATFVVNHIPFPVTLIPLFASQAGSWFTDQRRLLGDDRTNISLKSLLFDAQLSQGILSQADTKTSIDAYSTKAITFPSRLSKGFQAQSCIFFKAVYINNESQFSSSALFCPLEELWHPVGSSTDIHGSVTPLHLGKELLEW